MFLKRNKKFCHVLKKTKNVMFLKRNKIFCHVPKKKQKEIQKNQRILTHTLCFVFIS